VLALDAVAVSGGPRRPVARHPLMAEPRTYRSTPSVQKCKTSAVSRQNFVTLRNLWTFPFYPSALALRCRFTRSSHGHRSRSPHGALYAVAPTRRSTPPPCRPRPHRLAQSPPLPKELEDSVRSRSFFSSVPQDL
jgi:hypothetical protein